MRVLIACEFSGIVRDAFSKRGHLAISVDLLPTEKKGLHIRGDIRNCNLQNFDLMIAHPPCTHLSVSGARWFKDKVDEQIEALEFVKWLMNLPIPRIAIENPISIISGSIRKPDQRFQPYHFGVPERKTICLWLKNLPLLVPTHPKYYGLVQHKVHWASPNEDRWKNRSRFWPKVADAMAEQWGGLA